MAAADSVAAVLGCLDDMAKRETMKIPPEVVRRAFKLKEAAYCPEWTSENLMT